MPLPSTAASYPSSVVTASGGRTTTPRPASVSVSPMVRAISAVAPCLEAALTSTFMVLYLAGCSSEPPGTSARTVCTLHPTGPGPTARRAERPEANRRSGRPSVTRRARGGDRGPFVRDLGPYRPRRGRRILRARAAVADGVPRHEPGGDAWTRRSAIASSWSPRRSGSPTFSDSTTMRSPTCVYMRHLRGHGADPRPPRPRVRGGCAGRVADDGGRGHERTARGPRRGPFVRDLGPYRPR